MLQNDDDAPYKFESFALLKYCIDNYNDNAYITEFLKGFSPPKDETNAMQELMEEEAAEIGSSLDEKEEESDEQKEEEWSSYPCLSSNESKSLTHTLFDDGYDRKDSCETSLFDKNDLVIYDNPCYIDKSYDNPLFTPTIEMHDNEELCLEILYGKALDDGPMLLDDKNYNAIESGFVTTIFEMEKKLCACRS